MSILIKGMEMPTHCMDCPFMVSRDNDDCILQSAEANENFENWEQMKAGCPLIPVPEHGRWKLEENWETGYGVYVHVCTACNAITPVNVSRYKYCPNCGAKMDEEDE